MTDKELRKLKRSELLEILFHLQKEVETLRAENESLHRRLANVSVIRLNDEQLDVLFTHREQGKQETDTETNAE